MNFWIEDGGVKLNTRLEMPENKNGSVPLVILIHGLTGHMNEPHLIALKDALVSEGFGVLRAELYGHGNSGGKFADHNLYRWIDNTLAVIDYARNIKGVSDLYLAGHSQGGLTVMMAAAMKRETIKGLIALSPACMIPENARNGKLLGVPFDRDLVPDKIQLDEDHVLFGNYIRVARNIYVEQIAPEYRGPVLIVQGEADDTVPVQVAEDAAKLYENSELVIIPGDTHCYDSHCDQMVSAVVEWLKRKRDNA